VVLFGATGYAGGKILDEAVRRGTRSCAVARHADAIAERDGVSVRAGSLHDDAFLTEVANGRRRGDQRDSGARARKSQLHAGQNLLVSGGQGLN